VTRAWQFGQFGFDALERVELPEPEPEPHQVRVKVEACSINYRDSLMVSGHYNPKQPLPLVPLSDGAGVVDRVGSAVKEWSVGDRVAATFFRDWTGWPVPGRGGLRHTRGGPLPGMLQEHVVLSPTELVRVPDHLSSEEAATLPCAALTAWSALVVQGGVRASDVVVVQGTGGVALFAIQFAALHGARVIVTSSSDDRLARAKQLGATDGINYATDPEWGKAVMALTAKEGATHIVELGGAGTLQQSLRCIRPGGHVAMIGVLGGAKLELNILPAVMQNVRLQGVLVGCRSDFESMNAAIERHGLRPVIAETVPFDRAAEALAAFGRGGHFGKVVIRFD
jgi:NADPH:quinone reductase-like Zn-dependent oxidoreductase